MTVATIHNKEIAGVLDHIAELLEVQKANPHRIRAYRNGAQQIRDSQKELSNIAESGGLEALQALPGIGESLSRLIMEYVLTGRCRLLERLQGAVAPEDLFDEIPGIGPELAEHIVKELDVKTLEELEQAAYDGRLAEVEGFGPARVEAVRMSLAGYLFNAEKGITLNMGLGYRLSDAINVLAGIKVKSLTVGIAYDINTSSLRTASNYRGGFEIAANYIIKIYKPAVVKPKVLCPRF